MMWKEVVIFVVVLQGIVTAAPHLACPEVCSCQFSEDNIDLQCSSFEFINKLGPKQYATISGLTITNASVEKIDPKLKYLKNLKYLDLSGNNVILTSLPGLTKLKTLKLSRNNLKYINISALPPNLKELDLSQNFLVQIPRDWSFLNGLKSLDLYKNPLDCDCNNILIYNSVIQYGITIPNNHTLKCHSPQEYIGKQINSVNCSSLADVMLYDAPDEGSGDDIYNIVDQETNPPVTEGDNDDDDDNSNVLFNENFGDSVTETQPIQHVEELEGSGSDSDDIIYPVKTEPCTDDCSTPKSNTNYLGMEDSLILPACIINCSTPEPVGTNDEKFASPVPSFIDQAKMIYDDINVFQEESSTKSTTTTTIPTTTTEEPIITTETIVQKEFEPVLARESDKSQVESVSVSNEIAGEMERASLGPENNKAVYTIIGIFIVIVILVLIFALRRRKTNRRRRQSRNDFGEELKTISKPMIKPVEEKQTPFKPENAPLINGQNGKLPDDEPSALKTFTPLAPIDADEAENVPIRQKNPDDSLTPQRERVTIREKDMPDSIPKTPMFVHREKNSDGEFVITTAPVPS